MAFWPVHSRSSYGLTMIGARLECEFIPFAQRQIDHAYGRPTANRVRSLNDPRCARLFIALPFALDRFLQRLYLRVIVTPSVPMLVALVCAATTPLNCRK